MPRGRPKSSDPKAHTVQTFLTEQEYASLQRLRAWLEGETGKRCSMAATLRGCVEVLGWALALVEEGGAGDA